MISYGANLGLMVNAATGEVHDVALRGFLRGVDGLVQPNVKGYLTNTPPGSPSDGDVYIIGAAPTGAWAGNAGKVARWYANDGTWDFYTPKNGWMIQANSARESYRYTSSAWEIFYQEGTWTPTVSGLTVVGTPTYSGKYTRSGNDCSFAIRVQSTTSTASAVGTTIFSLPFTPSVLSGAFAVNNVTSTQYANGLCNVNGNLYAPSWAATSDIVLGGSFFI